MLFGMKKRSASTVAGPACAAAGAGQSWFQGPPDFRPVASRARNKRCAPEDWASGKSPEVELEAARRAKRSRTGDDTGPCAPRFSWDTWYDLSAVEAKLRSSLGTSASDALAQAVCAEVLKAKEPAEEDDGDDDDEDGAVTEGSLQRFMAKERKEALAFEKRLAASLMDAVPATTANAHAAPPPEAV